MDQGSMEPLFGPGPWTGCMDPLSWTGSCSETQGRSVGPGEKARRKFLSTGGKAPGYRLSPDHFQKVKRMLAPDWAQKMLCIILPIGEQFLLSSFREFVHDGYYIATVAWFVHQAFLTRNKESTDKSKNVSDAINRSNCTEKILFLTIHDVS